MPDPWRLVHGTLRSGERLGHGAQVLGTMIPHRRAPAWRSFPAACGPRAARPWPIRGGRGHTPPRLGSDRPVRLDKRGLLAPIETRLHGGEAPPLRSAARRQQPPTCKKPNLRDSE
jgi:hypothetical protein